MPAGAPSHVSNLRTLVQFSSGGQGTCQALYSQGLTIFKYAVSGDGSLHLPASIQAKNPLWGWNARSSQRMGPTHDQPNFLGRSKKLTEADVTFSPCQTGATGPDRGPRLEGRRQCARWRSSKNMGNGQARLTASVVPGAPSACSRLGPAQGVSAFRTPVVWVVVEVSTKERFGLHWKTNQLKGLAGLKPMIGVAGGWLRRVSRLRVAEPSTKRARTGQSRPSSETPPAKNTVMFPRSTRTANNPPVHGRIATPSRAGRQCKRDGAAIEIRREPYTVEKCRLEESSRRRLETIRRIETANTHLPRSAVRGGARRLKMGPMAYSLFEEIGVCFVLDGRRVEKDSGRRRIHLIRVQDCRRAPISTPGGQSELAYISMVETRGRARPATFG